MNRRLLLLLGVLLIAACSSGPSDTRPIVLQDSERLLTLGVAAHANSEYAIASDYFNRALAHYRSVDHRPGILLSHLNLTETALAVGQLETAQRHLSEARKLAIELNDAGSLKRLQLLEASLRWREGNDGEANALLEGLLLGQEETIDAMGMAALIQRTRIAQDSLDSDPETFSHWLEQLRQGLAHYPASGPLEQARLQRFEAQQMARQGRSQEAQQELEQALANYRERALRPAIAATLEELAMLHWQQRALTDAESALQRALYVRVWMMDRQASRRLLMLLGRLYQQQDIQEKAVEMFRLADEVQDPSRDWRQLSPQLGQRD